MNRCRTALAGVVASGGMWVAAAADSLAEGEPTAVARVSVINPSEHPIEDAPVVLRVEELGIETAGGGGGNFLVRDAVTGAGVPFQVDYFNGSVPAEIAFLADFEPLTGRRFEIVFHEEGGVWPQLARRTNALPVGAWESEQGGYHTGPAMAIGAFARNADGKGLKLLDFYDAEGNRIYDFNTPGTSGMEILSPGAGFAAVLIRSNQASLLPLEPAVRMRVAASGPVRSIVEMEQEPWESEVGTLQISRRAVIYAGRGETILKDSVRVVDELKDAGARFAVALRKRPGMEIAFDEEAGVFLQWQDQGGVIGEIGLGMVIAPQKVERIEEDDTFHYILLAGMPVTRVTAFAVWKQGGVVADFEEFKQYAAGVTAHRTPLEVRVE